MLKLKVTNQRIEVAETNPLVSNSKGEYECQFEFDETWAGFAKTAVFKIIENVEYCETQEHTKPVVIDNDMCIIPPILKENSKLQIGVFGSKDDIERPTVYTSPMLIRTGVNPLGDIPDPDPSIYLEILNIANEAKEIAQGVRDDADAGRLGVPLGGKEDQVLVKKSDADFDTEWKTGGAGASDWVDLENKPFDELNTNEMEVTGLEPNRQLGIKEISQSKVNGLEAKLTEIGQALQGKQPSGDYATKTELSQGLDSKQPKGDYALKNEIPTKISDLDNDSKFVNETQLGEVNTKVEDNTTAIGENTTAIGLKADKTEIPTKVSQLENDASYATTSELTTGLGKKLDLTGGKMQGKIDMASFGITNLPDAIANGEPVTFKQLNDAISGLGTVFNLKGSKPKFDDLPKDDNKIGDVWYVEDESVGYIWIEKNGVPQWEKFGPAIDLSGYLTKAGLLTTTGSATDNTMSQDAITKALNEKQPTGDYATNTDLANKFDKTGHTPNKNLVTDSSGNVAEADFEKPYKIVPSEQEVPYDEDHIIYREEDATGGGVDISLGMTGASVGQIVTVGSVDTDGKPTGYTPVTANEWNWGSY